MKTKQGASRRFGFIGYKTEAAAEAAINYFNNTFINTSRIVVEKAIAYRSEELPRPWSKYTPGSSAHEKKEEDRKQKKSKKNDFEVEETDAFRAKQKKNEKTEELINQLNADKNDPKLKEYLEVMMPRSKGKTWGNDDVAPSAEAEKQEDEEETVVVQHNESDDEYQDLPMKKKKEHKEDEDIEMEDSNAQIENDVKDDPMDTDKESEKPKDPKDSIAETGRLFVRNLTYACTEDDLKQMFEKYGTLSEVHMPIAKDTKKSKGYAYISYMLPEHAVKAYEALDMKTFQGRLLHIIPGEEKPPTKEEEIVGVNEDEMRELFGKYGELGRVLMPPAKTIAVVEFLEPSEARNAFKALAYRRFKDSLIYLEKAPSGLFKDKFVRGDAKQDKKEEKEEETEQKPKSATELLGADEDNASDDITSVFVKNLNFNTTIESLRNAFKGIEGYRSSRINVKPDPKNPGKTLSMGYGFIEFNNKANAEKAIKAMQGYMLDDHALDLKLSHHKTSTSTKKSKTPDTTKIIVRNVPFEATAKDLRELFSAYGQLKSLRLPKKFAGGHRGFAFLDFMTKQEAKNVYDNMANIHLYGRHLVLEWAKEEDKASENLLDASRKRRREESDDFVPL
ncbi:hypothetical protein RMATCC62417_13029 [Rhizopus microsporus]|nr:hypothetical protein RMATCC62417_13029 [Rhizopus microsporus]